MKNLLLTGASGFIGSHILERLKKEFEDKYDVYCLERYITGRLPRTKTDYADLQDYFAVKNAVRKIQPEVVIHVAAQARVAYSYDQPQDYTMSNYIGTINLAEACLREVPHFKHFLFASTSETYGNLPKEHIPHTENAPQFPNSPYAVSKLACEKYLNYMGDAYQFPYTILRPFNTYGRKTDCFYITEKIIVQMLNPMTTEVRLGEPKPVRDMLYVYDHANAYITCMEKPNRSIRNVFNFCTGRGVTMEELANKIASMVDYKGDITWHTMPVRPLDIDVLLGDNNKARLILDWIPKYNLEKGLQETIEFWEKKTSGVMVDDKKPQ